MTAVSVSNEFENERPIAVQGPLLCKRSSLNDGQHVHAIHANSGDELSSLEILCRSTASLC